MQPVKKVMLVLGAPLALAAMAGGAVAFASQSGGAGSVSAPTHSRMQSVNQTPDGEAHDGSDCPGKGAGRSGEGAVSPAVY